MERILLSLVLVLPLILLGKVIRSETSGDFYSAEYRSIEDIKFIPVEIDARNDIPELFEQKFRITEKTGTDSSFQSINGFRLQIFKTEDINEAKKRESMYIDNFGEENVLLIFEKPFYKIRVGRLRNKDEAVELQETLRQKGISGTIIVPDVVRVLMPEIHNN